MKKLFYYSIALLAAVSCAKEIAPQDNVETPKGDLKTFTIGACIDNSTIAPQDLTKGNLNSDLQVLWQSGDMIGLVTEDGTITKATLVADYDGLTEGVFEYQSENELDVKYAYYPYSETEGVCNQSVTDGKLNISLSASQQRPSKSLVNGNIMIMAAKVGEDATIKFKNTCSIAEIHVKGEARTFRNLYLHSPEIAISGKGVVDLTLDNPTFVTNSIDETANENNSFSSRYITLAGIGLTPGEDYNLAGYVVLPAGTYPGLTFELLGYEDDGTTNAFRAYSPAKEIIMNPGKVRPLKITVERPVDFVDLSAEGHYANCYMIQTEAGADFGFGIYTRSYSSGVGNNTLVSFNGQGYASVLWQSVQGLISSVTYNHLDKKIYFKRDAEKTGNAVIALRNRQGKVLYNWHIWVAGETVGTNTFENSKVLMDRNLGAYSSDSDYTMIGTFYQGGRKDPFPAASQSGDRDHAVVYPDVIKTLVAQDGKSSDWAACHPNVYIWGSEDSGNQDWLDKQNNNRWAYTDDYLKRVDDPCPYGYRVPINTDFNSSGANLQNILDNLDAYGIFLKIKDKNNADASFPMGGTGRAKTSSSEYVNVGTQGWLWIGNGSYISGSSGPTGFYRLEFKANNNNSFGNPVARRRGANVRCIKFTEN